MNITIISSIMSQEMVSVLEQYVNIWQPCGTMMLSSELKYHPDIICSQLGETLYMSADCISDRVKAVAVDKISNSYPNDCILNNLITDRYIITGKKTVLPYNDIYGKEIIRVAQGYVKCSVIDLGGRYITSDLSIKNKLTELGYDALLTTNDGVKLNGFSCGFIGGATAVIANKMFVFGDITKHIDHKAITDFAMRSVTDIICLSKNDLYDYGGAVTAKVL